MPNQVVNGAKLMCSFGTGPSTLVVTPMNRTISSNQPAATVMDFVPMTNIMPFLMCVTPSNPQVAAATSAALGVLTPQPCIPVTTSPWAPGSPTVQISNLKALDTPSICKCTWGGVITVSFDGQVKHQIP